MTNSLLLTLPLLTALTMGMALAETSTPMRLSMISLGVKDPARSVKFYTEILGLKLVGAPKEVTLLQAGDFTLVLNQPLARAAGDAIVGALEVIFSVTSVAASHRDLMEKGCQFIAAPREVTTGTWAATFTDPDGHRLTILGPQ